MNIKGIDKRLKNLEVIAEPDHDSLAHWLMLLRRAYNENPDFDRDEFYKKHPVPEVLRVKHERQ